MRLGVPRGHQNRYVLAEYLVSRITEDSLRSQVEGIDVSPSVNRNDAFTRVVQNCFEAQLAIEDFLLLVHQAVVHKLQVFRQLFEFKNTGVDLEFDRAVSGGDGPCKAA
jgi:hypothetical protein